MSGKRNKYDEEFKKNAVKLSHASPKPIRQVAQDLGISENQLYLNIFFVTIYISSI